MRKAWLIALILGVSAPTWAVEDGPRVPRDSSQDPRPRNPRAGEDPSKSLVNRTKTDVPDPFGPANKDNENILHELSKRKNPQVSPDKVYIDPITKQPLYKFADENFEAEPIVTDENGELMHRQKVEYLDVMDPIIGKPFKAPKAGNINWRGGVDRDFCIHSVGRWAVHANVWMSPDTGYAALSTHFGKEYDGSPLRPETIKFIKEKLQPKMFELMMDLSGIKKKSEKTLPPNITDFASYTDPTLIPDWIKYENALDIYEATPVKPSFYHKAKLHMDAAHANRRFLCGDINVMGLYMDFQLAFGKSVKRVNDYLLAESQVIQRERHQEILDPTQVPKDPALMIFACERVEEKGAELLRAVVDLAPNQKNPDAQVKFSPLDMFVLRLRKAAYLDRQGRIADAIKAVDRAIEAIPAKAEKHLEKDTQEFLNEQVSYYHKFVAERRNCLQREQEHLFQSAYNLMKAMYNNQLPSNTDWIKNSYLVGEFLRRDGREPQTAQIWFQTAANLLQNKALIKQWPPETREKITAWIEEGLKEVNDKLKTGQRTEIEPKVQETVKRVLDRAKEAAGGVTVADAPATEAPAVAQKKPTPATQNPSTTAPEVKTPAANPPPVASADAPKTRGDLYKMYYAALNKYQTDKKELPTSLQALIDAKYLDVGAACLNEKGKLICPETGNTLMYLSQSKWGDATQPLLTPLRLDPNKVKLFADGHVGEK